ITPLVKVQGAHLFGLLRQVTLANVNTIEWNARGDALHFERLAAHWRGSGGNPCLPGLEHVLGIEPDFVRFPRRIFAANYRALHACAIAVTLRSPHLQRLPFCTRDFREI